MTDDKSLPPPPDVIAAKCPPPTLKFDELPNEEEGDYYALVGMLIDMLGHIPVEGGSTVWHGMKFEIVDLDGARIDRVRVTPIDNREQTGEAELEDG